MDIDEAHSTENNEYFEVSLSNNDDNENSIHFIDSNHEFECIEEEAISQPNTDHDEGDGDGDGEGGDDDDDEDENTYYTIEIEDDFDFEKDSLIT